MMANQGDNAARESNFVYDVFLSFRGEDTRHSFVGYLYDALSRNGLKIFMDDSGLKGGDQISQSLLNAIEQSRISMVVFSEHYASSKWCLDELVKILECMKSKNQLVWPIFYKVTPSDVGHQRKSYAEDMTAHEERFGQGSSKVHEWRSALAEVAKLKGWHYESGQENEFVQKIVREATANLRQRALLDVGEHIIGHQSRIEEVKSCLDIESHMTVCMLGIHGTGGMGKTTLAKALYNSIARQFEFAIFLEDVRERSTSNMGLVNLQEAILSKVEGKTIKLFNVGEGVTRLKEILQHRKVLLVLDDVDSEDQLYNLAKKGTLFGSGSRIIITTRDKHVLKVHGVDKTYEMKGLNDHEALQLFCWNAFKTSQPAMNYEDVANRAVHYASGLPLALKVLGSHLVEKSVRECEVALKYYERCPEPKIQHILKMSYDSLEHTAKRVFLDIACFFKEASLQYVENVLERCDFFPPYNIGILVDKSLLAIENGCLRMHDLIQDMGREIVRQEAPLEPGNRSRLVFYKDVLKVLKNNSGSSKIEGIMLDPPENEVVEWSGNAFKKMNNLRILIVRNSHFVPGPTYLPNSLILLKWKEYPSKSLPSNFHPKDIVDLSLPASRLILKKEKPFPIMEYLTDLDFSFCQFMTHFPDASGVPNLRRLRLFYCPNLIAIHQSVGFLKKLKGLHASKCFKLKDFPQTMRLPSLQDLDLRDTNIEFFPHIEEEMCKLRRISWSSPRIKDLPDSISNLVGLRSIYIKFTSLAPGGLPSDLLTLPAIGRLTVDGSPNVGESFRRLLNSHLIATASCSTFNKPRYSPLTSLHCANCGLTDEDLDAILRCSPNLTDLNASRNEFVSLPAIIKESAHLEHLDVSECPKLEEIPELPLNIANVDAGNCPLLSLEASRTLWSRASEEAYAYGFRIAMPKVTTIPDWFDHRCEGGIVSFWVRGKFPVVSVAFIAKQMGRIRVRINGHDIDLRSVFTKNGIPFICFGHFREEKEQVFLFDLRHALYWKAPVDPSLRNEWHCSYATLDTFLRNEWNSIEVACEYADYSFDDGGRSKKSYLSSNEGHCGVYVYRKETNMDDIRFSCPNSTKGTLSIVDNPKKRKHSSEEVQA